MSNKQYRIIFSDLDGTLLNSSHQISAASKRKIMSLSQKGIRFVPVSGRIPSAILPYMNSLGIKTPIAAYSGAFILDENGNELQSITFPFTLAQEIISFIKEKWPAIYTSIFLKNAWYADNISDPRIITEMRITGVPARERVYAQVKELSGGINKILGMCSPEDAAEAERVLREKYPSLFICRSSGTFLEIMHKDANKAAALKTICRIYNIPVEESVAFGDNFNDIDMITAAGLGVAMGNSPDEVKKAAGIVALSNDADGILHVLEKIFPE